MNVMLRIGAFLSGAVLAHVIAWASGYLAAIPSPNGYFEFFGRDHVRLGSFVFSFLVYVLPVALFSFAWCWGTFRTVPLPARAEAWWCLAGVGVVWLYFQVDSALYLHNYPVEGQLPLSEILLSQYLHPTFWLDTFAIPLGLFLAARVVFRSVHESPSEAQA